MTRKISKMKVIGDISAKQKEVNTKEGIKLKWIPQGEIKCLKVL